MASRISIGLVTFLVLSGVSRADYFLTKNTSPTGIHGGLVIKNLQGETVKELAEVAADFNVLRFDPLRQIIMGTDELFLGDAYGGNLDNGGGVVSPGNGAAVGSVVRESGGLVPVVFGIVRLLARGRFIYWV